MTVTKQHVITVNWSGNLGGYSWEQTSVGTFSAPAGFTLQSVQSDVYNSAAGTSGGTLSAVANDSGTASISCPASGSGWVRNTWNRAFIPWNGSGIQYGSTSNWGDGRFNVKNLIFNYVKSNTVTAGKPIEDTDFTNVGLSATYGQAISNSNFSRATQIKASDWNSKTVTVTF